MIIGVPKEIKSHEYRVALLPSGVGALTAGGHEVLVERKVGLGSGFSDSDYARAGAMLTSNRQRLFHSSEMILKAKEPLPEEYDLLKEGQIVLTFFHFAASRPLTMAMIRRRIVAIPYETIQLEDTSLPILRPMSEIPEKVAVQAGSRYLERPLKGSGILLGEVPGVLPARVTVLGGGVAGTSAAPLGAQVMVLDVNLERLSRLKEVLLPNVVAVFSNPDTVSEAVPSTGLLIGAVLFPGRRAAVLVSRSLVKKMRPGSVIV